MNASVDYLAAPDMVAIPAKLKSLEAAIAAERSRSYCLRLWSRFIQERDGHRCVDCHSRHGINAHHIFRKALFPEARFLPGNGITLCGACHREAHVGFNRRPGLRQPVDAEGGEKLDSMGRHYSILLDDALERRTLCEEFYRLSLDVLDLFGRMQAFTSEPAFPGCTLEQGYLVLAETEQPMRSALAIANGVSIDIPPMLPSGALISLDEGPGMDQEWIVIEGYAVRTFLDPKP